MSTVPTDPILVDLQVEKALLGAILVDPRVLASVREIVQVEDFYRQAHRDIFHAYVTLDARGEPIDPITVKRHLQERGSLDDVGGAAYYVGFTDGVPISANAAAYAAVVKQLAAARRLASVCTGVAQRIHVDPAAVRGAAVDELRAAIESAERSFHPADGDGRVETLEQFLVDEAADSLEPLVEDLIPGTGTVLISGQPRDGKSLCALDAVVALSTGTKMFGLLSPRPEPQTCWYISDEDPAREVRRRLVDLLAGRGLAGDVIGDRLLVSIQKGINLDDAVAQDMVLRTVRRRGVRLLVVDPLRAHTGCVDAGPEQFRPFGDFLRRLGRETGVVVLCVHHDVKPDRTGRHDPRRPAQRTSGGAIFSAMTAPIATTRIDAHRLMLRPDGFKFGSDPAPIEVTFDWTLGLRLHGRRSSEEAALPDFEAEAVQFVANAPGLTSGKIASGLGRQRQAVFDTLKRLERAGRLQKVQKGRAHRWVVPTS